MMDLPAGWQWSTVGELAELINGDRGKHYPSKSDLVAEGQPFVNAGHLRNGRLDHSEMNYITQERFDLLGGTAFVGGDILYCLRGSLGKMAVVRDGETGKVASSLVVVRSSLRMSSEFIFHWLSSPEGTAEIERYDNGSAQPNLAARSLAAFRLPVPPIEEQKRIVAAIEEAFSKLDAGEAGLRRVRRLLERLRSSAIDAAIPQPGGSGVRVAKLGDLAIDRSVGLDCPRARQSPTEGTRRYVRMGDIDANGKLHAGRLVWINPSPEEAERYALQVGDVLFNTRNSRELVGKTGLVDISAEGALYNNNLLRIRFLPEIAPRFVHLAMNGSRFRDQLEKVKRATTSVAAVYSKDLVELEIAFPPADEQLRRVEAAEQVLSLVEAGVRALDLALGRSAALRRSVLKSAFEGRLVPQDPSDEPASVLLDQIRAKRAAPPVAKRRARQTA